LVILVTYAVLISVTGHIQQRTLTEREASKVHHRTDQEST